MLTETKYLFHMVWCILVFVHAVFSCWPGVIWRAPVRCPPWLSAPLDRHLSLDRPRPTPCTCYDNLHCEKGRSVLVSHQKIDNPETFFPPPKDLFYIPPCQKTLRVPGRRPFAFSNAGKFFRSQEWDILHSSMPKKSGHWRETWPGSRGHNFPD